MNETDDVQSLTHKFLPVAIKVAPNVPTSNLDEKFEKLARDLYLGCFNQIVDCRKCFV